LPILSAQCGASSELMRRLLSGQRLWSAVEGGGECVGEAMVKERNGEMAKTCKREN